MGIFALVQPKEMRPANGCVGGGKLAWAEFCVMGTKTICMVCVGVNEKYLQWDFLY